MEQHGGTTTDTLELMPELLPDTLSLVCFAGGLLDQLAKVDLAMWALSL